jgi:hypothetical protein
MYALGLMSTTSLHSVLCLLHLALAERTMSTFGKIMSRIFHHDAAADWDGERRNCCTDRRDSDIKGSQWGARGIHRCGGDPQRKASTAGQKLDWKRSIVDLMKLLDLDSSLTARKQLADEPALTPATRTILRR